MTLPLEGVRVLDCTDGLGESCSRLLADLGATTIRVEPPGGSRSRQAAPVVAGTSIPFAVRNANKSATVIDRTTEAGCRHLEELASDADILIESSWNGAPPRYSLGARQLAESNPTLVAVEISAFGGSGPWSDWTATERVLAAMSGLLSRSGQPGRVPLLPPAGLVEEAVSVHAAWSALLAFYFRVHSGVGQRVDLSAYEAVVHGFDPGFGVQGSAAAGRSDDFPRGRPDAANFYPVFPCRDGHVRVCLLAKRQWRAMFSWLGEPPEFADPILDTIAGRFAAADRLHPTIARLFSAYTRDELVSEGVARGIPIGGVLTPQQVLQENHFAIAGTFCDAEIAPGIVAKVPSGYLKVDGVRAGLRTAAPELGSRGDRPTSMPERSTDPWRTLSPDDRVRPFDGIRVLDLGGVVFGAELSRQFADNGADVIKVENSDFPDGLRQSKKGAALAASVAWGHRNKRSIGLNLRSDAGKAIFKRLVAESDIVLTNFKPGTMHAMGLDHEELSRVNPSVIVSESSAFGNIGPWSRRLGYGPLVRASCGASALWRYSQSDDGVCDGSTVYPDHIAAQVSAIAVVASLLGRMRSGRGNHLELAQVDAAIVQLSVQLACESLEPGSAIARGNDDPTAAPSGVYACAGDDDWCVIDVRDDDEWSRLCGVIGRPELADDSRFSTVTQRICHRTATDAVVENWLAGRTATEAMEILQEAGVCAGAMFRLPELLTNPQLTSRAAYSDLEHPLLDGPLPAATHVARFERIPVAPLRPAPLPGQHTREVCAEILCLTDAEIEELIDAGVLEQAADVP